MKSNSKIQKIYSVFDEVEQYLSKTSHKIDLSNLNKTLLNYYSPGPSFQYIYDFPSRKFVWVSESANKILGIDPIKFTIENYVDLIHDSDINHFKKCEMLNAHFLFKHIDKKEIPYFKVCYQLRMMDFTKKYKLFLRQTIAIAMDKNMCLSKVLCNSSDISHITKINNDKVSYINIKGGDSYYGISKIEDFSMKHERLIECSKRELDVLRLLAEGYRSKEIAEFLQISYDTVRTHRTNILKKTKLRSLTQVVSLYVKEGIL